MPNPDPTEDVDRGFLGALDPAVIRDDDNRVVWDNDSYAFLAGPSPDTVHPSLWRQALLASRHGLYEVTPGIYQVRGLDLSNMTLVEGDTGVIVIDPLVSAETAAAALGLYREYRGHRPVTGIVYSHSHVDHFGGVRGVVDEAGVVAGRVPVLAPAGFLEHAVRENVFAGTAMARRSSYMYAAGLPRDPAGHVGCGLGMAVSTGTIGLIAPTLDIVHTGQQEAVDGVRMVFQLTPDTEAPSEMNFYFPDHNALCVPENATHSLHNIGTLRGAPVRDAHRWAYYLTETIELFGSRTDVLLASHHWPTWGRDESREFLSLQRDLYAYLHDQTLRLMNKGLTGPEIAETIELPAALTQSWHTHGYYGSVSHNVKAIYQRYLGWFDGNPAHLWEHPPVAAAQRYVEFMGGADAVLEKARASCADGDYRWAAQVVNHVIFAEPDNTDARELQARALEKLAHGAENATWRNFYLTGAAELRNGVVDTPTATPHAGLLAALTPEQIFDSLAIRVDGPRAADTALAIGWYFPDRDSHYLVTLRNGVLIHQRVPRPRPADATITINHGTLTSALANPASIPGLLASGEIHIDGSREALPTLFALLEKPDPHFAIVTPE